MARIFTIKSPSKMQASSESSDVTEVDEVVMSADISCSARTTPEGQKKMFCVPKGQEPKNDVQV